MRNQMLFSRGRKSPWEIFAYSSVVLLLVIGLFMASVWLPPLTTPVHALNPPAAPMSHVLSSPGVAGTIASFTALIQDINTTSLPLIVR